MPRRIGAIYDGILFVCGLFAGFAIASMALLITLDVILRNLGLTNFPWLLEVSEYILYISTFMAAPWVLRLGSHVRVDLLLESVPKPLARALDLFANFLGLGISFVLVRNGGRIAWDSFERGDILFKEIIMPEWPLLTVIPIAGTLLIAEFARRIALGFLGREPEETGFHSNMEEP